jgi:Pyridine nucleotide-disulphide oxidoreductase, dimerisation domain
MRKVLCGHFSLTQIRLGTVRFVAKPSSTQVIIGTGPWGCSTASGRSLRAEAHVTRHLPFLPCAPVSLNAHIVGPHADEVINFFGIAMRHNLTIHDLKSTMFAYPTGASDIGYML